MILLDSDQVVGGATPKHAGPLRGSARIKVGAKQTARGPINVARGITGVFVTVVLLPWTITKAVVRTLNPFYKKKTTPAPARSVTLDRPIVLTSLESADLKELIRPSTPVPSSTKKKRSPLKALVLTVGLAAVGAAAFSVTRRAKRSQPPVAAAPPHVADVPSAVNE